MHACLYMFLHIYHSSILKGGIKILNQNKCSGYSKEASQRDQKDVKTDCQENIHNFTLLNLDLFMFQRLIGRLTVFHSLNIVIIFKILSSSILLSMLSYW